MAKLTADGYRFPAPADGIQVNFCKNVSCEAFGVPETLHRIRRSKFALPAAGDYRRGGEVDRVRMVCALCGSKNPVRSNAAIADECRRLNQSWFDTPAPACPDATCVNHGSPVSEVGRYAKFGKTKSGTARWRCNACKKTFSEKGKPLLRQRMPHKNRDIFLLLVNKSPLRRICEITGLGAPAVYGKISFIGKQCQAFVADREKRLYEGMLLPKMYVAVDRQTHNVNWSSRRDRRNVQLSAIGSADLNSGYVFGFHINFDPALDPVEVEREATRLGDLGTYEPYRHFARVWLSSDYDAAVMRSAEASATKRPRRLPTSEDDKLQGDIADTYDDAGARADVEVVESTTEDTALPELGMLIKEQYTMHGHFQALARMLAGAEKVRFYLDQDSGMRAAFLGAFAARVKNRSADAWYVRILKEATIYQKERAVQEAKTRLAEAKLKFPSLSPQNLLIELMKEEMGRVRAVGPFHDLWLSHPHPNMSEPVKEVCWLTDMGDYDREHAARLYLKASLHAVDRFFMQTRRLLSLAERSIVTASADRRVWHGYSAYKPENLARVLEIFRVYYNYCKVGKDKKTPAMRLGLARAPIAIEAILYHQNPGLPVEKSSAGKSPLKQDVSEGKSITPG